MTGGRPRKGTTNLTSAAGSFTIRPANMGGCTLNLTPDICLVNTAAATTGAFRNVRYDTAIGTTVLPKINRINFFANGHYDLTDGLTLFSELGYYHSHSVNLQPAVINLNGVWIPASNYWNPFGATTINGQPNPNRIAGLTNVPAAGLPVLLGNYRFVDAGPQTVDVKGSQLRALVGLKGEALGFKLGQRAHLFGSRDRGQFLRGQDLRASAKPRHVHPGRLQSVQWRLCYDTVVW